MPALLNGFFKRAEHIAEKIVEVKDVTLGELSDFFIPRPEKRLLIRQSIIKFIHYLPISRRISETIDKGIEKDVISVSNLLSLSRIPAGLIYLLLVYYEASLEWYLVLISWAFFSDIFDGILARKMKQITELGAALDPVCDKIFAGLVAISYWQIIWQWWWNALTFLILDSFLLFIGISVWYLKSKGRYHGQAQVKSNYLGKIKFCLQGLTCLCYILSYTKTGHCTLLVANCFAIGSTIRHLSPKTKAG